MGSLVNSSDPDVMPKAQYFISVFTVCQAKRKKYIKNWKFQPMTP